MVVSLSPNQSTHVLPPSALEASLPSFLPDQLCATAAFMEALPRRYAKTGEIQGEVLHIAAEIRGLANALAA